MTLQVRVTLLLLFFSQISFADTIIKCENRWGEISYADSKCPAGSTQLSKTVLQPYKTSQSISLKDLKKSREFPAQSISSNDKAVFISRFSQVLTSMSPIKAKLSDFYMRTRVWPESFHALKLNPKALNSSLIEKTHLSKNGRVKLKLKPVFGANKQVWFYPQSVMGNTQLEWHCYANFPASWMLNNGFKLCESRDI